MKKFNPSMIYSNRTSFVSVPFALSPEMFETCQSLDSEENGVLSKILRCYSQSRELCFIALILYFTGARISEVLELKPSSFLQNGSILITGKKGSASRVCHLPFYYGHNLIRELPRYKVFQDFNRFYIYREFKKRGFLISSLEGDRQKVTHSFRHLYIRALKANGLSNEQIKEAIGHRSIKSTEHYVAQS